ncbi:hypothetical protein Q7689_00145 [Nocardiopsis tropica]|uniref:hypothetical protein n=1 Tax=Nocardiopsis tropica TaxID=109330 RepID=UPI002E842FD3|nr:hypothetical protein [Nocardiopsis tropica]
MALPHTYTDDDGDALRVGHGTYTAYDALSGHSVGITAPTGQNAVELARAILAAAGDTGHVVVSIQGSERTIRIRESIAAETMRERAAETAYHDLSTENAEMADAIRKLPLLPDGVAALRNAAAIHAEARTPLTADTDA